MTTQAQGKGKKKNKDVMKLSLDEFNQIDAPHGHSVVSVKMTGLDWAETMADHDQQSAETQQIIVPAAPRAQRGPAVDYESLPNEPPFRATLFNVPVAAEEKDIIDRLFNGLDVKSVDIQKATTTVEFGSKNDLYEALGKDGASLKGRFVNVCLYGQSPPSSYGHDRYGGRGSNSSYGERSYQSAGGYGPGGQRSGDRYGDRPAGGFNRDRDNYTGYNRGGSAGGFGGQPQRGGYGQDRFIDSRNSNYRDMNRGHNQQYTSGGGEPVSEEPQNWRSRPAPKPAPPAPAPAPTPYYSNGARQSYTHARPDSSQAYHQAPSHYQNQQHPPSDPYYQPRYQQNYQPQHHSQQHHSLANNRPTSSAPSEERPKLVIHKRKTPINVDDVSEVKRNESIFGQAKPSSKPYQKMFEIEEKLKSVQIVEQKQPGSAPRSRHVSGESNKEVN